MLWYLRSIITRDPPYKKGFQNVPKQPRADTPRTRTTHSHKMAKSSRPCMLGRYQTPSNKTLMPKSAQGKGFELWLGSVLPLRHLSQLGDLADVFSIVSSSALSDEFCGLFVLYSSFSVHFGLDYYFWATCFFFGGEVEYFQLTIISKNPFPSVQYRYIDSYSL